MDGMSSLVYKTVDPNKKNAVWADQVITLYRRSWRQLINVQRAADDRATMFSMNELTEVKNSFQDEKFKEHVKFYPLPILDTFVNAIVEEITKEPPKAEIKATDPAAINEKKEDLLLLRNRKIVERDISKYNQQIGMPPYKVDYGQFKGNVEQFDKMGLNENDPEDMNFYEDNFQRLHYETAAQQLINNILKVNCFDETIIRKLVKDIFAFKAICVQVYVDQMTGEIKYKYIDPQICYGVFGATNDGKDDVCRGWQDSTSVWEFLQMVGNEFDFQRDWRYLIWAINYCNTATRFTGFIRNGVNYDCCANPNWMSEMGMSDVQTPNLLDWSMAYTYKIFTGYIEWRSIDATATYLKKHKDPDFLEMVSYGFELKKKKEQKEYYKESYYQQQWYRSYFIATTSLSQWLFGFQKVYYQQISGANDEYSNGTLCYYQEEGKSATEISRVYLQPANFAFYHMLWLIYKAKPDEDEYLIDEMVVLAKVMARQFPQMAGNQSAPSFDNVMNQVIQYQRKNHVRIRAYPQIEGKVHPQLPPEKPKGNGGLDPLAIAMQSVNQWAEMNIAQKIGMNQMRIGGNPPSRESNQSEQSTIQYSINTTGYMYRMVQYLKQHLATVTLTYAQDIINFKESLPYKYIRTMLGDESFEALKVLDNVCAHRMGIFVKDYNSAMEKQRMIQAADIALSKGTIRQDEWFILTQTEDPKRANAILARLQRQKEKRERAQAIQDQQMAAQMQQQKYQMEKDLIVTKGQLELERERERTKGFVAAAQIAAKGKVDVKELQVASEAPKQDAKTEGQQQIMQTKQNLEEQQNLAASTAA